MKKTIIGSVLIFLAFILLISWELIGREALTMKEVAFFKADLYGGHLLEKKDITYKKVRKNLLLKGAVNKKNEGNIIGKALNSDVQENQMVTKLFFKQNPAKEQEHLFVIKGDWLAMRSSSLRKDDLITILSYDGMVNFGTFRIGSVRSLEEFEITEDGIIYNIEILASLKDYLRIRDYVNSKHKQGSDASLDRKIEKLIIVKDR